MSAPNVIWTPNHDWGTHREPCVIKVKTIPDLGGCHSGDIPDRTENVEMDRISGKQYGMDETRGAFNKKKETGLAKRIKIEKYKGESGWAI